MRQTPSLGCKRVRFLAATATRCKRVRSPPATATSLQTRSLPRSDRRLAANAFAPLQRPPPPCKRDHFLPAAATPPQTRSHPTGHYERPSTARRQQSSSSLHPHPRRTRPKSTGARLTARLHPATLYLTARILPACSEIHCVFPRPARVSRPRVPLMPGYCSHRCQLRNQPCHGGSSRASPLPATVCSRAPRWPFVPDFPPRLDGSGTTCQAIEPRCSPAPVKRGRSPAKAVATLPRPPPAANAVACGSIQPRVPSLPPQVWSPTRPPPPITLPSQPGAGCPTLPPQFTEHESCRREEKDALTTAARSGLRAPTFSSCCSVCLRR